MLFGCMVDISMASSSSLAEPSKKESPHDAEMVVSRREHAAGYSDDDEDERAVAPKLGYEVVLPNDDDDQIGMLDESTFRLASYFNLPDLYRDTRTKKAVQKRPLSSLIVQELIQLSREQLRALIENIIGIVVPRKDIDIKGKFKKVLERPASGGAMFGGNSDIIHFSNTKDLVETYSVAVINKLFKVQCADVQTLRLYGAWVNIVLDELIEMQKEAYDQAVGQVQQEANAISLALQKEFDAAGTAVQIHNREYDQEVFKSKFFGILGNVANIGSVLWLQPWKKNAEQALTLAQEQMAAVSKRSIGRRAHQIPPVPKAKELSSSGYGQLYPWIHLGVFCGVTMWTLYKLKQAVTKRDIRNKTPLLTQATAKNTNARLHVSLLGDDVLRADLQLLRDEVTLLLEEYKVKQERALIAVQTVASREGTGRGALRITGSQHRPGAQLPHEPQAAQSTRSSSRSHRTPKPQEEPKKSTGFWSWWNQ